MDQQRKNCEGDVKISPGNLVTTKHNMVYEDNGDAYDVVVEKLQLLQLRIGAEGSRPVAKIIDKFHNGETAVVLEVRDLPYPRLEWGGSSPGKNTWVPEITYAKVMLSRGPVGWVPLEKLVRAEE